MRPEGTAGDYKILSFTDFLYRNISYGFGSVQQFKAGYFSGGGGRLCDTRNPIILMHVVCVHMAPTPVVVHQVSPFPQIVHSVRFMDRNKKP